MFAGSIGSEAMTGAAGPKLTCTEVQPVNPEVCESQGRCSSYRHTESGSECGEAEAR